MIQSSLRSELKSDVTVITVAHRLQTIMDSDKIVSLFPSLPVSSSSAQEDMLDGVGDCMRLRSDEVLRDAARGPATRSSSSSEAEKIVPGALA